MPFKVTDEGMDYLDSLTPEDRDTTMKGFTSNELEQITSYAPQWKERKAQRPMVMPEPKPFLGITSARPIPPPRMIAKPSQEEQNATPTDNVMAATRGLQFNEDGSVKYPPNQFRTDVIDPTVGALQRNIGKPLVETMMKAGAYNPVKLLDGSFGSYDPMEKLTNAQVLSSLDGSRYLDAMPVGERLHAVEMMRDYIKPANAENFMSVAEEVPTLPLMFINPGMEGAVAARGAAKAAAYTAQRGAALPILDRLVQHTAEVLAKSGDFAATGTALSALKKGSDMEESAKNSALIGAGFGVGGKLVGAAAPFLKAGVKGVANEVDQVVARFTPKAVADLAKDVNAGVGRSIKFGDTTVTVGTPKAKPPAGPREVTGTVTREPRYEGAPEYVSKDVNYKDTAISVGTPKVKPTKPSEVTATRATPQSQIGADTPKENRIAEAWRQTGKPPDRATVIVDGQRYYLLHLNRNGTRQVLFDRDGKGDIWSHALRQSEIDKADKANQFFPAVQHSTVEGEVVRPAALAGREFSIVPWSKETKPSMVNIAVNEAGVPEAQAVVVTATGGKTVAIKPLVTPADKAAVSVYLNKHDVVPTWTPEALAHPVSGEPFPVEPKALAARNKLADAHPETRREDGNVPAKNPPSEMVVGANGQLFLRPLLQANNPPAWASEVVVPPAPPIVPSALANKVADPDAPSELAYWSRGTGPDGKSVMNTGELIGVDAKRPENLLVKMSINTAPVSVPKEQVFPAGRGGFDKAPLLRDPINYPPNRVSGLWTDGTLDRAQKVANLASQARATPGGAFQGARTAVQEKLNLFLNRSHTVAKEASDSLVLGSAVRNLANSNTELKALKKALGEQNLDKAFDRDISRLGDGRMSVKEMENKWPDEFAMMRKTLEPMMREILANEEKLRALGALPPKSGVTAQEELENGDFTRYLTTIYRAHLMPPGEWLKIAPQVLVDKLIAWLTVQNEVAMKAGGEAKTAEWIRGEVGRIMQEANPLEALRSSAAVPANSAAKSLLAKDDTIPQVVKDAMGEETSGVMRFAVTLGKQRALLANHELWNDITQGGINTGTPNALWSPGPRGDLLPEPLPDDPRLFGRAAGGYIHPDLADLVASTKIMNNPMPFMNMFGGWIKGNQVAMGGMRPWINAVMGNWYYGTLAGGVSPLRPVHAAKYMKRSVEGLLAYTELPTSDHYWGRMVLEARQHGVEMPGFAANEISSANEFLKTMKKVMDENPKENFTGWMTRIGQIVTAPVKGAKWAHGKAGIAYDQIDRVFKFANYLSLREKFLNQGMELRDATRLASKRINDSFPNPQNPAKLAEKIRQTPFGFMAPYSTYFIEDLRIHGMLAKRMVEESDLRWRLLAAAAIVYGMFNDNPFNNGGGLNGMLRRMNGITDEEEKAARLNQSDGKKAFRPLMIAYPWRDSQGRVQFMDLGQWWGPSRLMQGNPDDPMYAKFVANLVLGTVNGGFAEPHVNAVLNKVGLIDNPTKAPYEIRAESPLMKFLSSSVQAGFVPGAIPNTMSTLRQGGYMGNQSQFEDTLTPAQTAQKLAGLPVLGAFTEDKSGVAALKGDVGKMYEVQDQLKRIMMRPGAYDSPEATVETNRMVDSEIQRVIKAGAKMDERGKANDAARK